VPFREWRNLKFRAIPQMAQEEKGKKADAGYI
jgi:hypothetical protein